MRLLKVVFLRQSSLNLQRKFCFRERSIERDAVKKDEEDSVREDSVEEDAVYGDSVREDAVKEDEWYSQMELEKIRRCPSSTLRAKTEKMADQKNLTTVDSELSHCLDRSLISVNV